MSVGYSVDSVRRVSYLLFFPFDSGLLGSQTDCSNTFSSPSVRVLCASVVECVCVLVSGAVAFDVDRALLE